MIMFPGVGYLTFGFMATHGSREGEEDQMDPNVALQQLRQAYSDYEDNGRTAEDADRMRDHVVALDEWLTSGGFLPAAWGTRVTQSHPLPIGVDEALSQLRAVIEEKARLGVGTLLASQGNCND